MGNPEVSVILVTWNSGRFLHQCLEALTQQTFRSYEVVMVDNGSTDDGLDGIIEKFPELDIRIKELGKNTGFAAANNVGARLARGNWLALLNADAFPAPDWLEHLHATADQFPEAFFASRQVQAESPETLDGEGDAYHISGLAWRRGYGLPVEEKEDVEEIFSPCAAAALYPRQAFLDAGGFDEDYFSYHEDIDLGFRLRMRGLGCYYVPKAVVQHVGSASTGKKSDFSVYYGHRNLVWNYFKNMPAALFWLFLPIHLMMNLSFLIYFTFRGQGKAIWRAKMDALRGLNKALEKRKSIQRERRVSTRVLYRVMNRDLFAPLRALVRRQGGGR